MIAAVRDPESVASKSLQDLPKGDGSQIIVVKIDSASETDAAIAVKHLESTHNIHKIDIVIANAGIADALDSVAKALVTDFQKHVQVNAVGPILLFQAVLPLLQRSSRPVFTVLSSMAGSIGGMNTDYATATYGASKAMINYLVRKIHFEHKGIIAFPINPG